MATKAKQPAEPVRPSHASTLPADLDEAFLKALKLMDGGRLAEAVTALEEIHARALAAGLSPLVHGVRARLEGLKKRDQKMEAKVPAALMAQVLLTRGEDAAAMTLLEKGLVAEPGRASLHYLNAIAQVRADRPADAAKSLARAFELDPELRYTFFLESEFEDVRDTAPFAPFQLA